MTQAKGAPEFLFAPELLVRSDWDRHALNMDIHGGYLAYGSTFFPNSPVWLNRPNLDSRVNARIDIDTQDRVDLEGRLLITTDNPGSPNIQAGLERLPVVTTGGATLGYTHDFNRFELTAKGTIDRTLPAVVPDQRHLFEQRRSQFRPVWRIAARQLRPDTRGAAVLRGRRPHQGP
jgi:hypothetical protein